MSRSVSIRRVRMWWLLCAMLVIVAGCKGDDAPLLKLSPLSDATAYVGQEFTLPFSSSGGQSNNLEFSYKVCMSTGQVCTVVDISGRADLRCAANECVFRWTPIASDVGDHMFDFIVSDGKSEARETVKIAVKPATGSASSPVFREPMGTGTSHDVSKNKCLTLNVVVEDPDSPGVQISQLEPLIEGAKLDQKDDFTATWTWCPTPEQIDTSRFRLLLQADDGDNPPVIKLFLIVLRKEQRKNCPGEPPVIVHTPQAIVSSLLDLDVEARISDDKGLKYEPLLYYSLEAPADTPDPDNMMQLPMKQKSGTSQDGVWTVKIPNPVAGTTSGTEATVYYMLVAEDNDDPTGDCDHETISPTSGTHVTKVTNPGGSGGKGLCEECSSDMQCGKTNNDLCAIVGTSSKSYCLRACSTNADCGNSKYTCSSSPIKSVDGKSLRQCIPTSGSCVIDPTQCTDDKWEPNDTLDEAKKAKPLPQGTVNNLVMCPGETRLNEDWFPITINKNGKIIALLEGEKSAELDFELRDIQNYTIAYSRDPGSDEIFESCVHPGTYFIRVFSSTNTRTTYSIEYTFSDEKECIPGDCIDDPYEYDDNANEARIAFMTESDPYKKQNNVLCPNNEDWFLLNVAQGDVVRATIEFTQTSAMEDLDLYLYKGTTNLTPCNKTTGDNCKPKNGQSTTSNETLTWNISDNETYYLVVRGFNGSSNEYDICIGMTSTSCPKL